MKTDQIISLFGTQQMTAKVANVTQPTVSFWKSTGQIPFRRQRLLLEEARKQNIPLEPKDFFEGFE